MKIIDTSVVTITLTDKEVMQMVMAYISKKASRLFAHDIEDLQLDFGNTDKALTVHLNRNFGTQSVDTE